MAAGDFNLDGKFELAVGAPGWNASRGRVEFVQFAPTSTGTVVPVRITFNQDTTGIPGTAAPNDQFGAALTVGNFANRGDGYYGMDLAIGVPGEEEQLTWGQALTDAGAVIIVQGGKHGLEGSGAEHWSLRNAQPGARFGSALTAGNFNGHGFSDLAVGAPNWSVDDAGAVFVIWDGDGNHGVTRYLKPPDGRGVAFGHSLASGDLDADTFVDLVIGAPFGSYGVNVGDDSSGYVMVLRGSYDGFLTPARILTQAPSGTEGRNVTVREAGDLFGYAIAIGDFNGDHLDDIAVGAPGEDLADIVDAGAVNIFYSWLVIRTPQDYDWFASDPQFVHQNSYGVLDAAEPFDLFGLSLATGNFGGTSYDDLAIGVPREDSSTIPNSGAVAVLRGSYYGITTDFDHFLVAAVRRQNGYFGSALHGVGVR
jgi:hypothetical protein